MGKLKLEIITPEKIIISREVDIVVAPGIEGEFGVLPGHVPFLSALVPGEVHFTAGSERVYLSVTSGFTEISNDKVSILVDAAETAEEIDIDRAKRALQRSKERLVQDKSNKDIDFLRAEASLKRAIARIKVAEKTK